VVGAEDAVVGTWNISGVGVESTATGAIINLVSRAVELLVYSESFGTGDMIFIYEGVISK
jgi:hypothetical protein